MLNVSPSIVRPAYPQDYTEVARMCLQYHNESGDFSLDFAKVDWLLSRLINPGSIPPGDTGTRGVLGVIGPVGALEGMAAVIISNPWYSSERVLNDLMTFVDPGYRNSGHAKALLDWMKQQSISTGIPLISGVVSKERTAAKVRLYERQMPNKIGAYFLFDPKASVVTSSGMGIEGYAKAS